MSTFEFTNDTATGLVARCRPDWDRDDLTGALVAGRNAWRKADETPDEARLLRELARLLPDPEAFPADLLRAAARERPTVPAGDSTPAHEEFRAARAALGSRAAEGTARFRAAEDAPLSETGAT